MRSTALQRVHEARPCLPSLRTIHERLLARFGPAGWWPAETPFEVCVGAILVQNTAWTNVERALQRLREEGLLRFEALDRLGSEQIAPLVRPAGCHRVKARRLRALLDFLGLRYGGRVEGMASETPAVLRAALLEVSGIGRETADSIALYAAGLPLFVVDAYTRRVFSRLGYIGGEEPYDDLQRFFVERLPVEVALYNEFHAQVVLLAKEFCRPRPRCAACPLTGLCPRRGVPSGGQAQRSRGAVAC
jgi:endonuclease-3 related protein